MTTATNPFAMVPAPAPAPPNPLAGTPYAGVPASVAPSVTPPTTDEDPFSGPAPQMARGPRVRDLYGRLLLLVPHKVETVPNRLRPGETQDRMTADVVVLDGGPIPYGGRPEATPPIPHDKTASIPHKNDRMFLSQAGLVSQCREALAKRLLGKPGMVLGRLAVGEAKGDQNPPYLLTPPTDTDKALARSYLSTVDPFV